MPREIFRDTGHNIIEIADSDSEQESLNVRKQSKYQLTYTTNKERNPFASGPSNPDPQKSPAMTVRRPVEIIELSSSSDEEMRDESPLKRVTQSISHRKDGLQSIPVSVQSPTETPARKAVPTPAKRKYIIADSSEEEQEQCSPPNIAVGKSYALETTPQSLRGVDTVVGDNGTIQYALMPRRPARIAPPAPTLGQDAVPPLGTHKLAGRRTLLKPNPPRPALEDLSWEHAQDELGGVRSGAMLTHLSNAGHEEPPTPSKDTAPTDSLSSPTKTPRRKKMPEAIAALHRLAIPYLKELDSKVFGNRLGAHHLPEIESLPPGKKKRGQTEGVIWGMGTRGDFNDGKESYIELVWSNKMTTTAGRTEYKKTARQQVTMRIELGVKVVTNRERLRSTLAHEACHAASWAISGDFKQPHGRTFKSWAAKVEAAFPDVEVTTKHDYEIDYKFLWKCLDPNCGHVFQRHSNSINLERQGCFCGSRLQLLFQSPDRRTPLKQPGTSLLNSAALGNGNTRASPRPLASSESAEEVLAGAFTSMTLSTQENEMVPRVSSTTDEDSRSSFPESMPGQFLSRLHVAIS